MFVDSVDEIGTRVKKIPCGFTSVSQKCDVGVIKPFKTSMVELYQQWKVYEYTRLVGTCKIPTPGKKKVLDWLDEIWRRFPSETIRNSFGKCGFF